MVALPRHFTASPLPLLPGRLLQQTDAVHAAILLLLMRRLLQQANALHQAILLLLVRRLLLQATPDHIPLLHATGCNLRTLLFYLPTWQRLFNVLSLNSAFH